MPRRCAVKILLGATRDAGVVDQNIQLAEMSARGVDYGGPVRLVGDLELFEAGIGTDRCRDLLALLLRDIRDDAAMRLPDPLGPMVSPICLWHSVRTRHAVTFRKPSSTA